MATQYLKQASKRPETETGTAQRVAGEMVARIAEEGEAAVRRYAHDLDRWTGPIVVEAGEIEHRVSAVPEPVRADIEFAIRNVRRFADAQRESVKDFAIELMPGLTVGQKLVPCNVTGCYVPTGR